MKHAVVKNLAASQDFTVTFVLRRLFNNTHNELIHALFHKQNKMNSAMALIYIHTYAKYLTHFNYRHFPTMLNVNKENKIENHWHILKNKMYFQNK